MNADEREYCIVLFAFIRVHSRPYAELDAPGHPAGP